MTAHFRAVLFDCDGVLQRPTNDWQAELGALIPAAGSEATTAFLAQVHEAEAPTMDGSLDFPTRLADVLERWDVSTPVAAMLPIWQQLSVDQSLLEVVDRLTQEGLICALATNQHAARAAYMRRELGYERWFDPCFYSCEIGLAKPDPAFFRFAVERLGLAPRQVLFTDDVSANVAGAREAGLVAEHFTKDGGRAELDRILALHGLGDPLAA